MMRARTVLLIGLVLSFTGCAEEPITGPPQLRLGHVECAECGMIVSEDRFSAAFLIDRRGRREHLAFDDIGCMLDHEREHGSGTADGLVILERFVHDHDTRAWAEAGGASFLLAEPDRIQTPMGSGIAAFGSREGAESARATVPGVVMDYNQLIVAREEWMRARYGPRSDPK